MAIRPNFTDVVIDGNTVEVHGVSDDKELAEILDIRVVLAQGDRIAGGRAEPGFSSWKANVTVADPTGEAQDFEVGDAVAFGVETHRENLTTITWAQTVQIASKR